ncbi:MAG: hypothetical protein K0U93_29170 [Gammaproteobacteria bacterium]|nr:hypothetical protein [Gammaproteobacteria bacterium]
MTKKFWAVVTLSLSSISVAQAHGGISSIEGLWIVFLVLGVVILALLMMSAFWLKITYHYLTQSKERFYRLRIYLVLTIAMSLVSGASAFTFHRNAPYSQNVYFLVLTIVIILVSTVSVIVQYKRR